MRDNYRIAGYFREDFIFAYFRGLLKFNTRSKNFFENNEHVFKK